MISSTQTRLNLGCGKFKKEGFINVDIYPEFEPDVLHDLNLLPYPFADDKFELIEMDHVLEHLKKPLETMRELHRISKNGGRIAIHVPHFSRGFTHPEHKAGFDVSFPLYFDPRWDARYTDDITLKLVKLRLNWLGQGRIKKQMLSPLLFYPAKCAGFIISFFANLSPVFCSRVWCFWVGGFDEMEMIFSVKK